MSSPTVRDVARVARVSLSTVGRALNDKPEVSSVTRDRVRRAAEELGYHPNALAKGLKGQRTHTVALVFPNLRTDVTVRLIGEIEERLRVQGYLAYLCVSNTAHDEARLFTDLVRRGVDGVILYADDQAVAHDHVPSLLQSGCQIISLLDIPRWPIDVVAVDRVAGTTMATRHLQELGRRHIALVGHTRLIVDQLKVTGYTWAMEAAGLPLDIWESGDSIETYRGGYNLVHDRVSHGARPDGLICTDDLAAIGAVHALLDVGLRVPHDVAVVGFNGLDVGELCRIPLTTVVQPLERVADQVVSRLLMRLTTPHIPVQRTYIRPTLRIRASCGAAPDVNTGRPFDAPVGSTT